MGALGARARPSRAVPLARTPRRDAARVVLTVAARRARVVPGRPVRRLASSRASSRVVVDDGVDVRVARGGASTARDVRRGGVSRARHHSTLTRDARERRGRRARDGESARGVTVAVDRSRFGRARVRGITRAGERLVGRDESTVSQDAFVVGGERVRWVRVRVPRNVGSRRGGNGDCGRWGISRS